VRPETQVLVQHLAVQAVQVQAELMVILEVLVLLAQVQTQVKQVQLSHRLQI
jgi:hypothetical protein